MLTDAVSIREAQFPHDGLAILTLDTSFVTDRVFDVEASASGFELRERRMASPLTKRLPLDDLSDPARSWTHAFVAETAGGVVGFAAAGFENWNRRLTLWHLYVAPGVRGRGIGRKLVARVETLGRDLGAGHIWLETSNVNPPAIAAYRAMGFSLTGLDLTLYDGTPAGGETALFFSREIGAPLA